MNKKYSKAAIVKIRISPSFIFLNIWFSQLTPSITPYQLHRGFYADDLKLLRVAMSSFFDMLLVCAKTLMEFDDGTTQQVVQGKTVWWKNCRE